MGTGLTEASLGSPHPVGDDGCGTDKMAIAYGRLERQENVVFAFGRCRAAPRRCPSPCELVDAIRR